MKGKYYKKETVIYQFKHDILITGQHVDDSDAHKHQLWEAFLLSLRQLKKISRHQASTWAYPTKELSNL